MAYHPLHSCGFGCFSDGLGFKHHKASDRCQENCTVLQGQ